MPAIIRDIVIEQGGVFDETFVLRSEGQPVDLSGYSSRMIVKDTDGLVIATYGTVTGEITIDGPLGSVRRRVTAPVTRLLPVNAVSYDWELTPPSGAADTWKLYRGRVRVIEEGTRGC